MDIKVECLIMVGSIIQGAASLKMLCVELISSYMGAIVGASIC